MSTLKTIQKDFPNVKEVVDGKRRRIFEVLPEDVERAEVKSHKRCAAAIACKRTFHLDGVLFGVQTAYLVKGKKAVRYAVPETVSREITSFDRKGPFVAGVYHVRPVCPSRKLGTNHRGGKPTGRKLPPTEKKLRHHTKGIRAILGGDKDVEVA